MPDQTPSSAKTISVNFPSGEELYNTLMADIEADLLTQNIPNLNQKYAGETKEQNAERLERYRRAYEKYDEAFASWMQKFDHLVNQYRKEALKMQETESLATDSARMNAIEREFAPVKLPTK